MYLFLVYYHMMINTLKKCNQDCDNDLSKTYPKKKTFHELR